MTKLTISSLLILCVCLLVKVNCLNGKISELESIKMNEFKDMGYGVYRADSYQVGESTLSEKAAKSGMNTDDLTTSNTKSTTFIVSEAKTEGTKVTGVVSDKVSDLKDESVDKTSKKHELTLKEKVGGKTLNVGSVSFESSSSTPWSYELLPKTFRISTLISDEDDRKLAFSKLTLTVSGEEVALPLSSSEILYSAPKSRWRWGSSFMLGVGADIVKKNNFNLSVNWSGVSFGTDRYAPKLKFMSVGVYMDDRNDFGIKISPVAYNLSDHIPYLRSTYIAPCFDLDRNLNWGLGFTALVNL